MPYISSSATDNAVNNFVGNTDKLRIFDDCLTLANSGSVGACFYQPFKFVASDHVTKLKNANINKYEYLFLASVLSRLGEKYSFNREINDVRIMKEKVLLPAKSNGDPDYDYMANYVRNVEAKQLSRYVAYLKTITV